VEYSAVGKGSGVVHDAAPAVRVLGGICDENSRTCTAAASGLHNAHAATCWALEWRGGVLTASNISVCVGKERGWGLGVGGMRSESGISVGQIWEALRYGPRFLLQ
jgi:hypothetical protein